MQIDSVICVDSVDKFIKKTLNCRNEFDDDPFIVTDLTKIKQRFNGWAREFPKIEPFFALKAQHNSQTVNLLADNSCGFDVASLGEMRSVIEAGTDPNKILYAQPYKQPSHLRYALKYGIVSVCDTVDEIMKVSEVALLNNCLYPKILIRILPDDKEGEAQASLSSKFGAPLKLLPDLAQAAKKGNVSIIGISFHVGSHCHSSVPYQRTLKLSRVWWDGLEKMIDDPLEILDIGGGYPGEDGPDFSIMAKDINQSITEIYGDVQDKIRVIAEPGRYMVTSSVCVVANVVAEKHQSEAGDVRGFVLNTGVYGGLSHSMWDRRAARSSVPYVVRLSEGLGDQGNSVHHFENQGNGNHLLNNQNGNDDHQLLNNQQSYDEMKLAKLPSETKEVVLWGPTCDSSDKLVEGYCLDGLKRGDWIVFPDLGAYGTNIMTTFNGFPHPKTFYVRSVEL